MQTVFCREGDCVQLPLRAWTKSSPDNEQLACGSNNLIVSPKVLARSRNFS